MKSPIIKLNSEQSGFTLIELMIAAAIAGILLSVAMSYYGDNVISAKRTDGRSVATSTAASLEKCRAIYGAYNNANCNIQGGTAITSPDGYYSLKVTAAANTFTLTASPSAGSAQAKDTECTSIILNHLGQQSGTGSAPSSCW